MDGDRGQLLYEEPVKRARIYYYANVVGVVFGVIITAFLIHRIFIYPVPEEIRRIHDTVYFMYAILGIIGTILCILYVLNRVHIEVYENGFIGGLYPLKMRSKEKFIPYSDIERTYFGVKKFVIVLSDGSKIKMPWRELHITMGKDCEKMRLEIEERMRTMEFRHV